MSRSHRAAIVSCLAGAGVLALLPDLAHRWAAAQSYGGQAIEVGTEAILVLGCPSRDDGSLHPLQRWRCDIAARTMNPRVGRVVFTGRTGDREASEAAVMAESARSLGIPDRVVVLEEEARSTWENLHYSAQLVEEFDVVRIVSDPMHGWRARQFLAGQRPDLAAKLAPARDHRWLERPVLKTRTFVYEVIARYREWRTPRLPVE